LKSIYYITILAIGCVCTHINARTYKDQNLNKSTASLRQHIVSNQQKQQHLINNIKSIEKSRSQLNSQSSTLQKTIKQNQHQANRLKQQHQQLNQKIDSEKRQLSILLKWAYLLYNQHHQIPLGFFNTSQKNSNPINLVYYRSLQRYQAHSISNLKMTVAELQKNQLNINIKNHQLIINNKKLRITRKQLNKEQQQRNNLLEQLQRILTQQHQRLSLLENNQKELESTIKKRNHQISFRSIHFQQLQGKLKWPIKGRITSSFNSRIGKSELRTTGVSIKAPSGTPVHAIAPGQVVFSNWLMGYGNLLIISHGNGYITLYGHNQSIVKKSGDWVKKDEMIATIGDTGGQKKLSLYFAIRHNTTALNPAKWCHQKRT
jgi:murein hydrolase activator